MNPKSGSLPTRERILVYLEEHRTVSVQELSRSWRLTPADIRYHLGVLIDEGRVERVPRAPGQPAKRGRPAQHYRLSTAASPDNLPVLCSALLQVLLTGSSQAEADRTIRAVAAAIAGDALSSPSATILPVQRLNHCVDFLRQHGYRARWEAGPSGPRILLRICPYAAILEQHPELCQVDHFLLEILADLPFEQTARMNPHTATPPACVFTASQIGQPA